MNDFSLAGLDGDRELNQFLAVYDAPAYIRRARETEAAYDTLVQKCRQQREGWLEPVRKCLAITLGIVDLGMLASRPGSSEVIAKLRQLVEELGTLPSIRAEPGWFSRPEVQALRELAASVRRFNARWRSFLATIDLDTVNRLREGYNRWYVLEKECAVRNPRVAQQGFQRLPMLTREELGRMFPLLPEVEATI